MGKMTNYEFVKSLAGKNADACARKAEELYGRRQRTKTNLIMRPDRETLTKWLFHEFADTALAFDVGQFVQFDKDGSKSYGVVKGFWQSNMDCCPITGVLVDTAFGTSNFDASELAPADLPESVLMLAMAKLKGTCPLKGAPCGS